MKIAFTIGLLLGIVSQADAAKIGRHRHHHHHNQNLAQYSGEKEAWIDSCSPSRKLNDPTYGSGTQGAPDNNGKGSFEGVGVDCQGFSQKKGLSFAQIDTEIKNETKKSNGTYAPDNDAWIPDCDPDRNMSDPKFGSGTAGQMSSYKGVGVECQGFAQRRAISLMQKDGEDKKESAIGAEATIPYKADNDAWVDSCDPDRNMSDATYGSGTYGSPGASKGTYDEVGTGCQGFAQKRAQQLAQHKANKDGDQAWIPDCSPARDLNHKVYGSGTQGAPNADGKGSFGGVGIDCQGFIQKNVKNLVQKKAEPPTDFNPSNKAWVDDCSPSRNMSVPDQNAGTFAAPGAVGGHYPGVGITCQGFSQQQKKDKSLLQIDSQYEDAWIPDCSPGRDLNDKVYQSGTTGSPMSNSAGSYPGVGIVCQGFTQIDADIRKDAPKTTNSVEYKPDNNAWINDCDPQRNLNDKVYGSGTFGSPGASAGTYPGVGVECQGFAQVSHKKQHRQRRSSIQNRLGLNQECPDDDMADCNGTNGVPGVDCC